MSTLRIGDVAARLGIATHVLRHWEDAGVLEPARLTNGHRAYDEETVTRAQLIRLCQRAGMSLSEIGALYHADRRGRAAIVRDQHQRISEQIDRLRAARDFLEHTLHCRHPMTSTCPDCNGFASEVTG